MYIRTNQTTQETVDPNQNREQEVKCICNRHCSNGIFAEVLKLCPTIVWGVVCLISIPAYATVGWATPIVCAVFSVVVSVMATYDIATYLTPNMHKYAVIYGNSSEKIKLSQCTCRQHEVTQVGARNKLIVSAIFTVTTAALALLFLVVGYAFIEPDKIYQPCNGTCGNCSVDPFCTNWVRSVQMKHKITILCSPAFFNTTQSNTTSGTDATFSCLADGFWMIVTFFIGIIWFVAACCILRNASKGRTVPT